MAIINKGTAFSNGEQLSASKLNNLLDGATFGTDSVDNSSTLLNGSGAITVRDSGITAAKIATNAVETAKIADANVTFAKLADVIDDDTMATATATTIATSESIKAYVDAGNADNRGYESLTNSTVSDNVQQNTTGRPLWTSFTLYASGKDINWLLLEVSPNSDMSEGTRIGQSRISSDGGADSGTQVTGIVPSNYYWKYAYSLASGTPTEMVHSSFIL